MKYEIKFPKGGKFSLTYNFKPPEWFTNFFWQFVWSYYYSATRPKFLYLNKFSKDMANLLTDYFHSIEHNDWQLVDPPKSKVDKEFAGQVLDEKRHVLMFTSGKDSLDLLLRLLGDHPKENILCLYLKNINRSETHYEQKYIKEICKILEVNYEIIECSNGVSINRTGHNIGLRDQLILGASVPYILKFNAKNVWFGIHHSFTELLENLYTSHQKAFRHMQNHLEKLMVEINVRCHLDAPELNELLITKRLIENNPELLRLTSSCYAQQNFRERHYANLKKKFPTLPLYEGCGHCVKCCRINGAIFLYDKKAQGAPDSERYFFKKFLRAEYMRKFKKDETLTEIINLIDQQT